MKKAKDWLIFAHKDIIRAKQLSLLEDYEGAAFHLQQSTEKSLKALIVFIGIELPSKKFRTHNISFLINILREHLGIPEYVEYAASFTRYAFEVRYPDDYVPVSKDEYEEAYEIALKVYEWAKGIIESSSLE